jgi:hypothetical protein
MAPLVLLAPFTVTSAETMLVVQAGLAACKVTVFVPGLAQLMA